MWSINTANQYTANLYALFNKLKSVHTTKTVLKNKKIKREQKNKNSVTSYIFIYLHIFLPTDVLESVWHDKCCQRLEAELGTPWCNGFNDAANIVTDQTEAGCFCFLFHCASKGCLKDKEASIKKRLPYWQTSTVSFDQKELLFLQKKDTSENQLDTAVRIKGN